jgi:hypothetical protein
LFKESDVLIPPDDFFPQGCNFPFFELQIVSSLRDALFEAEDVVRRPPYGAGL